MREAGMSISNWWTKLKVAIEKARSGCKRAVEIAIEKSEDAAIKWLMAETRGANA